MYEFINIVLGETNFGGVQCQWEKVRVHLEEWILGRLQKKKKKKKGREYFLECVWLEGGEGKKMQRLGCFLPRPTIKFSSQNR